MDPANNEVRTAVQGFCQALADANSDSLAYTVGSSLLDDVVPWQKEWPNTLTGQLTSEGVLTKDMAWLQNQYRKFFALRTNGSLTMRCESAFLIRWAMI